MVNQALSTSRGVDRPLRHIVSAPVRVQTYRNLLYLALMFPLGFAYFVLLVVGFSVGVSLSVVLVGIPIVILTLALSAGLAAFERTLARVLLRVDIPATSVERDRTIWGRITRLVIGRRTWKAVIYLLSEFLFGIAVFTLLTSLLTTAGSLLLTPLYYMHAPTNIYLGPTPVLVFTPELLFGWDSLLVGLETTIRIDSWQILSLPGALLTAGIGAVLMVLSLQLFNSLAWLWGRYTRMMLGAPRDESDRTQ